MGFQVGVIGGSGYAGGELLRLLAGHPEFEVNFSTARSAVGKTLAALHPGLGSAYADMKFSEFDAAKCRGLDLCFIALPHGVSQGIVAEIINDIGHIVDLGVDFRLPAATYEEWYGAKHQHPELSGDFTYGLTELFRQDIHNGRHVANPGCYPTAVSLTLAPLMAQHLATHDTVIANCASGVSGAGRELKTSSLFAEANEQVSAYGLLRHRHTPEMDQTLSAVSQQETNVLFSPHLVPITRGIIATCYAKPANANVSTEMLLDAYRDFYANESFIHIVDNPPGTKAVQGSNAAHITVRFDNRTNTILAIGVIDNLVKGAAGQAIQNANLISGIDETLGLPTIGMFP